MIDYQAARKVAARLAALAEPTRVRVIDRLAHGPLHVGALAELLDVPMVNLSHHLGVMRQAGLLEDEKEGRRVVYRLHPDVARPGDGDALAVLDLDGFKVRVRKGATPPAVTAKPKKK
ncbi:ArsR/SmtB family transcription factor [Urbifossiella limnaea]|uniref:HTH-type transcriptional regulator NmtR n=1 Tax=Urbifossiella limnaea TaxID=2528023 RepID=A0A517XN08_9BACT|nr:metalloregulator ArsR/SmtB family transcription factor [Urbifossiella limnaea]QDU18895.1 HTH-type transcriptional regulator NmtR [Urbifossiella limnaea]